MDTTAATYDNARAGLDYSSEPVQAPQDNDPNLKNLRAALLALIEELDKALLSTQLRSRIGAGTRDLMDDAADKIDCLIENRREQTMTEIIEQITEVKV